MKNLPSYVKSDLNGSKITTNLKLKIPTHIKANATSHYLTMRCGYGMPATMELGLYTVIRTGNLKT